MRIGLCLNEILCCKEQLIENVSQYPLMGIFTFKFFGEKNQLNVSMCVRKCYACN